MTPRQSGSRENIINLPKMHFGSSSLIATVEESDNVLLIPIKHLASSTVITWVCMC